MQPSYYAGSEISPAYVTDLTWLIEKHRPRIWISGHTRFNHEVEVKPPGAATSTLLISNQRGYSNIPEVKDRPFDPELVIGI